MTRIPKRMPRKDEELEVKDSEDYYEEPSESDSAVSIKDGDRWVCVRCATCCRWDFSEDWLDFLKEAGNNISQDANCKYLTRDITGFACSIYPSRPNACRGFPFTLRKNQSGRYFLVIHKKCKGLGQGQVIDIKEKIDSCVGLSMSEFGIKIKVNYEGFEKHKSVIIER